MDIGAPALSNHRQTTSLEDLSPLPPDRPGAHTVDWNVINRRVSPDYENWDKKQLSSLPDGSKGAGSTGIAFFDEIMNYSPTDKSHKLNDMPDISAGESNGGLGSLTYDEGGLGQGAKLPGNSVSSTTDDGDIAQILIDFKKSHGAGTKHISNRDYLRSYVSKYLRLKLANKLNLHSIKEVPWSQMKAEDILNWPLEVKFGSTRTMDINELARLHELAKEDLLDFSDEFLRRFTFFHKRGLNADKLRSDVANYLRLKLAKKLNVLNIAIPWSQMKAEDILNWPSEVKFGSVRTMDIFELVRLHELAEEDLLDFSDEFLRFRELQLVKSKAATPESRKIIKDIEKALCNKLNAGTNKNFRWVPWSILKKADVINWPEKIPFIRLSRHKKEDLKLLHKLREAISFSNEFLKTLSDPSFYKTPIGRHIIQSKAGAIKSD